MRRFFLFIAIAIVPACFPQEHRTSFRVRYVLRGSVYIDGGSNDGLGEGIRLSIKRRAEGAALMDTQSIAEVVVVAVASTSAVCEVRGPGEPKTGDLAFISDQDFQIIELRRAAKGRHRYAQIVSFTEEDPLDEEARDEVPRPPLPEINRIRGRVSFEHSSLIDRGDAGASSYQNGGVVRADMTRIAGTFWNFTGYWRGRLNSRRSERSPQTIQDLLNRTYHIGAYYNNPKSHYTAGFGRLYVPWATSLSTIDGGYIGRRIGEVTTVGAFGGSTPDPTAWNYSPNRQIFGAFTNFDLGSFETLKFTSTSGIALTRFRWHAERQFAFFENSVLWKQNVSVYHNLEVEQLVKGRLGSPDSGLAVGRSFMTVRLQPSSRVSFDLNHNHFRQIPTFDLLLLGTGLLDRFLFDGFSAGVRVDVVPSSVAVYANLGRSARSGDERSSLNQLYGVTLRNIWNTGIRTDLRYSKFTGSFGSGDYQAISLSREMGEQLRFEVQGGHQSSFTPLAAQTRALFVNSNLDWFLGRHYVLGGGVVVYRGEVQNYDQIFASLGYRF